MDLDKGLLIGLMSGTSADGIDACLVQLAGHGLEMRFRILAHREDRHPRRLRQEILTLAQPGVRDFDVLDRLINLHNRLGHAFAGAAHQVAADAGVEMSKVSGVGLHGQTLRHRPPRKGALGWEEGASLQLGNPHVVAETLRVRVVHDLRGRDLACGGQGAPLVPFVDHAVFGGHGKPVVALNLGGMGNLTWVPPGPDATRLLAYDTGPANSLMDAACRLSGEVKEGYDRGGRRARRGRVDEEALGTLLALPYFRRLPPKSTGVEEFGEALVREHLAGLALDDQLATLARLTARSVGDQLRYLAEERGPCERVVVSGGGIHNQLLMELLREELPGVPFVGSDEYGIPVDAKEAFSFAVLAHQTLSGRAGNLPAATGARAARVLGSVVGP